MAGHSVPAGRSFGLGLAVLLIVLGVRPSHRLGSPRVRRQRRPVPWAARLPAVRRLGSSRRDGPLEVVDCTSLPANLLESELFGHERGAFTGAVARREGAFALATGGTLFLDEVGELPVDLQPKLLRAIEQRSVRPLGSARPRAVDVRIVAATNRDLRVEVNEARFRSDLYYRLAVLDIRMPPLRQHPEDIRLLVRRIASDLGAAEEKIAELFDEQHIERLRHFPWPGNVRQLRNYVEQCLVFSMAPPLAPASGGHGIGRGLVDASLGYADARLQAIELFERDYALALLEKHHGNVSAAARSAGMSRPYLHRLLHRHGLR